ncbi:hypothetical protein BFL36_14820 [Clavibacter michiganensis]|uniref:Uncharacterized protein n=1 Tax=Clavibacter michiganensis TaxID=28447 RepID=A0A251Y120_9MICO|nr:hypothetical protein BFL36_14820 [Clavibacter michiganensis]
MVLPHVELEVGDALGVHRILRERRRAERVRDVHQRLLGGPGGDPAHPLGEQPPLLALREPPVDQPRGLVEGAARRGEGRVHRSQVHQGQPVGTGSRGRGLQGPRQSDRAAVPARRHADRTPVEARALEVPAGGADAAGGYAGHPQRTARHLDEPPRRPGAGHDLHAGVVEAHRVERARAVGGRRRDERVRERSRERAPRLRPGEHGVAGRGVVLRRGPQRVPAALRREDAPRAGERIRVRGSAPAAGPVAPGPLLVEDRERVEVRLHRPGDPEVRGRERGERLPQVARASAAGQRAVEAQLDGELERARRRPLVRHRVRRGERVHDPPRRRPRRVLRERHRRRREPDPGGREGGDGAVAGGAGGHRGWIHFVGWATGRRPVPPSEPTSVPPR